MTARKLRVISATFSGLIALASSGLILQPDGVFAMAESSQVLGWEWRAGRELAQRAGLRITRIRAEGGGLFGWGRFPSLGAALPEAQVVEARVIAVDKPDQIVAGAQIRFRIPKVELRGAAEGDIVAVGIIGGTVVSLVRPPTDVSEDTIASWLPAAM